jgi:hypothetical protein
MVERTIGRLSDLAAKPILVGFGSIGFAPL